MQSWNVTVSPVWSVELTCQWPDLGRGRSSIPPVEAQPAASRAAAMTDRDVV
ncbi:hypothetical protein D3C71_2078350 [compost metagenome]